MSRPRPSPVKINHDGDDFDEIEAAYEPLSPTESTHSGDLALANWGSIAFEDLLYTDEGLQDIVKSFRAAVIDAIKKKDFNEAHTKAEEQAKFLRDYIRRCMGAEHVCCDSEDYEQAQKIAKAIKYAVHIKKVTSEQGGLAFGAVRRIQELLSKYKRHNENTRLEMKEAGEQRNYTKAIAMQHDLESSKNDYSLKLCAHVDRILESGNLRALEVACRSIQEAHPELQPEIMNVEGQVEPSANNESSFEGPAMIAAPPGTARRPHSARSAREEEPEKHRFDGSTKLNKEKMKEMGRRLCVPKKTMEEKATTDDELQKGKFMLQEEYDNCTFRPTIGVKGVIEPSIAKKGGTFWPTDRYPRRAPSPHGKARYEGDTNLDPEGVWQLRRCMDFVCDDPTHGITSDLKRQAGWTEGRNNTLICSNPNRLEGVLSLIKMALEDETQIMQWELTPGEVEALKNLKGQPLLFQVTDDLRSKAFLKRAASEVTQAKTARESMLRSIEEERADHADRIHKITKIKKESYRSLTEGTDTPGRQKRRQQMAEMCKSNRTVVPIEQCKELVVVHCQFPDLETILESLEGLVADEERCRGILKCDPKEWKKLKQAQGDTLIRLTASLCKRAKFVSRMDSYNFKTKA